MTQPQYAPRFDALSGMDGVLINDPVEDVQCHLYTDGSVTPKVVDESAVPWCFPIDSAAAVGTATVTMPFKTNVHVRTPDGTLVASAANDSVTSVDESGPYTVELGNTPVKLYMHAESRILIVPSDHETEITFPDVDSVYLGARTRHKQPARTLTTTTNPEDLMRVVSEFGGALKTTSPERSFPTLRGHPPLIELGDEVTIPGGSRRPETGVRIEVPASTEYIFPVAPLAFYLGAEVVSGPTPRLTTVDGYSYDLDREPGFETTVHRVLKQVFTIDCLTRVEGYYPVDLAERRRAEADPRLDLDYATLYDRPLRERVATSLEVPFEAVEPVIPEWRLTADLASDPTRVDVLPHLTADLAYIRCDEAAPLSTRTNDKREQASAGPVDAVEEFLRGPQDEGDSVLSSEEHRSRVVQSAGVSPSEASAGGAVSSISSDGSSVVRSSGVDDGWTSVGSETEQQSVRRDDVFRAPDADSATQVYVGDGFPIGANKASAASYERKLTLRSNAPGRISVTVVCNDEEMMEEIGVGDYYGSQDLFEFDVDIRANLTREGLRKAFQSDADFIHYIGHVDQRGLQATDGYFDAHEFDDIGVTAFFLNGCRSFRQGSALVDAGAVGGIVTLENVHNGLATELGHHIARLLNAGWPLDGAVELVKEDALAGRHYIVVGDGSVEIANPDGGVPTFAVLDPISPERYELTFHTYPTRTRGIGTLVTPYAGDNQLRYLASGKIDTFNLTSSEVEGFLNADTAPILLADKRSDTTISLRWSDQLNLDELADR